MSSRAQHTPDILRDHAIPIASDSAWLDDLVAQFDDAHLVLLGEATHGTHEFYALRAQITQRLIDRHGFRIVAVEADWPDAYRANRYVHGEGEDAMAVDALSGFKRFPQWMWRNHDVVDLVQWLHQYNRGKSPYDQAGFYGLDLYSLHSSMHAVVEYLNKVDPASAQRARERYACFEDFGDDPQSYGYATSTGLAEGCEDDVVAQLVDLRTRAWSYLSRDGLAAEDELFSAEQNARLAQNAESYYRQMYQGRHSTWNLRDRHMMDTLEALLDHKRRQAGQAKAVVWAHNSHLGDARATSMHRRGELNVGQLVRERHGDGAYLVGFTTYNGEVSAASAWDAPVERKRVRDARPGSYEYLLHDADIGDAMVPIRGNAAVARTLLEPRLERAIGVIYRPESEMASHYFQACMADQFDAVIHIDRSSALVPLERTPQWEPLDLAETYPFEV